MLRLGLLVVVAALLAWSAFDPYDRLTWWLEVAPVLLAAPVLVLTARRFPLTHLVSVLIALATVSRQAWRAGRISPAQTLRSS